MRLRSHTPVLSRPRGAPHALRALSALRALRAELMILCARIGYNP